ncbi:DMT family transporter [Flavobacteriaceae bacterium]|nr:DMT family transporter [Flavobacteriaceae bacterium]
MEYLILSSLFFAINNVLWKWVVADYLPLQVIVKRSMVTSLFGVVVLCVSDFTIYTTLGEALFVNSTCVIGALGLVFMIYALKESTLNNFIHYSLLGSIGTASYLYFVEDIVPKNYLLGILLILLGFSIFLRNQRFTSKTVQFSTHCYLMLMTLCFSISGIMQWYNLKTYGVVFLVIHQEIEVLIIAGILIRYLKQPILTFFKFDHILLMAPIVVIAIVAGMLGLKATNPFISSIFSLTTPILTMILATIVLKEHFKWHYVTSMVLVVLGTWMLC